MDSRFKNWGFARIVRLAGGIGIGIYAIYTSQYIYLMLAAVLLIQAAYNLSCCGASGCGSDSGTYKQNTLYKDQIKNYNPEKK